MIGSTYNVEMWLLESLPPHWWLLRTRAALLLSISTPNAAQNLAHSQGSVNTGRMSERVKECSKFEVLQKLWDSKAGSAFPLTSVLETLSSLISLVFVSLWRFLLLFYLQLLPLLRTISFLSPALHVGRTEMADTCHICTWLCQQVLYGLCLKQWCLFLLFSIAASTLTSYQAFAVFPWAWTANVVLIPSSPFCVLN